MKAKNRSKPVSRKEARKAERKEVKQKKHQAKVKSNGSGPSNGSETTKKMGPLTQILAAKGRIQDKSAVQSQSQSQSTEKKSKQWKSMPMKDPLIEKEDMELARLSKLLGIEKSGNKTKAAKMLNKEYDLYEGMGEDFGDFLMQLDDLTDMVEGKSKKSSVFRDSDREVNGYDHGDTKKKENRLPGGYILDDDEQEVSDIDEGSDEESEADPSDIDMDMDMDDYDDDDDDVEEGLEDDMEDEEEEGELSDSDANQEGDEGEDEDREGDSNVTESEGEEGEDNSDESGEEQEDSEAEEAEAEEVHTYRPIAGEDIYGRSLHNDTVSSGKYVPPAKRRLLEVDENSEQIQLIKRQINGLMNRLSEQSKDSIIRSLRDIFCKNSVTICSKILKDSIVGVCSHPTQIMSTLIPVYAAIMAALHNCVSVDIGAFMIESLTNELLSALTHAVRSAESPSTTDSVYITTKLPANALLILVYLYNLRVLHHTLIVDIMNELAGIITSQDSDHKGIVSNEHFELRMELLDCIVQHCGVSIRSDDPMSLKNVINTLSANLKTIASSSPSEAQSSRGRFLLETITDLHTNKSKRTQNTNADTVKQLRKWLGSVKTMLGTGAHGAGGGGADNCLRISLEDLRNAETKGRWWKTGASWVGKLVGEGATNNSNSLNASDENRRDRTGNSGTRVGDSTSLTATVTEEEKKLLQLAKQMRMNSETKRRIFVVLMSSRDVSDAYERLSRLELKGKEDREIPRILAQCCGRERTYNPFYAELAHVFCTEHRQHKMTFQYIFWDAFKTMSDEESEEPSEKAVNDRRTVNLARLLASLICSFQLPLSVIKPIEIDSLSPSLVLFLSTLLLAIFKEQISDDDYQSVFDRVATTKDFATVRDTLLFFLQKYIPTIPKGMDTEVTKKMQKRRKVAIKTLEAMSILDISRGLMKED